MRRRSAFRNWLEFVAARSLVFLLATLPLPLAHGVSRACARLLDLAIPRLRRVARRNLQFALPESSASHEAIIDGVFVSIARLLVLFARLPSLNTSNIRRWIRYEGYEHFEQALARGRGVLFATAHLGNWELSAFAHALLSSPMHIVVRPLDNPLIDAMVARHRALSGNQIIEKKDFARGILQALKRNEAAGILIDQNASLEGGVFVDFFGVPACAGAGFAKLAAHSGAAVIPGFALWSDRERKYVLRFCPAIEMTGDPAADTQAIHRRLEEVIREHPDQWLWIHRRWKTRPPGEPDVYASQGNT